jgi:gliding motility-associated-like protein
MALPLPTANGIYDLLDNDGTTVLATSASGSLETPPITAGRSFFVRFTRGECNSSLSQVNIKVFDSTRIFVPNAFTPNGDGINDKWHIVVQGRTTSYRVSVYNRRGMLVYSSSDPGAYWDGSLNGQPQSGTFVYIIVGKDYFNRAIKLSGTVIIVR